MALITENIDWADGSGGGTALSAANLDSFRLNLFNEFNGSIDNNNIKAGANIALAKLASGTSAYFPVCNGAGVPTYVAMSGDATMTNAGVVTVTAVAAANSLDDAYNTGSAITVDTAAITLTVPNSSNNLSLVCVQNDTATPSGNVEFENAGTATNLLLDQNGNGVALSIDTEATGANGITLNPTVMTTGHCISIPDADALTTGSILNLASNSSSTAARTLLSITNSNASSNETTLLKLVNTGGSAAQIMRVEQNSNSNCFVFVGTGVTTQDGFICTTFDALTTGTIARFQSNSPSASTRSLVKIVNDHVDADDTVLLTLQQDGGDNVIELTGTTAKLTAAGVWTDASSVNLKENFGDISVLDKIKSLSVNSFNYKGPHSNKERTKAYLNTHFGPTSEDFYSTFGIGDGKGIAGRDLAAVAVQGLKELLARVEALEK